MWTVQIPHVLGYLRLVNIKMLLKIWKVFSLFTMYMAYRIHNIGTIFIFSSCNCLAISFLKKQTNNKQQHHKNMNTKACY